MIALRWLLGFATVGVLAGVVVLATVAREFRRSFGASPANQLLVVLPVGALVLLLAGLVWPSRRILLHAGALAAVGLIVMSFADMSTLTLVGIAYCALWLVYYGLTVARVAVPA
ncbi:MAG: hypothetical protein U1E73_06210 [Planctomycetota bacterium]